MNINIYIFTYVCIYIYIYIRKPVLRGVLVEIKTLAPVLGNTLVARGIALVNRCQEKDLHERPIAVYAMGIFPEKCTTLHTPRHPATATSLQALSCDHTGS